jgi:hypothetical protein
MWASPNTLGPSPNARFVLTMRGALIEAADEVEQKLTAGLENGT